MPKKTKQSGKVPGIKHGTTTGYTWHKCRCKDCRGAWAAYQADLRARKFGGEDAKCRIKGCPQRPWAASGNGLCHIHHRRLMALRERKARKRAQAVSGRRKKVAA